MDSIDIVIPWVDGSDLEWHANKNMYSDKGDYGNKEERLRG